MKKILASILSVTVLVASMPAEAAFGSRSSSSSSSSRSYSSSSSSSSKSYSSPSSSRSYSSSSPSSYRSTPSSSASSSSSTSSGSFGSSSVGKSGGVGMQRSDVTQSVRDGSYKQTMPSNNTTVAGSNPGGSRSSSSNYNSGSNYNNYNNGSYGGGYNNYGGGYASQGHSTGTLVGTAVGAAVVGGLVGYMLHRDNNGNVYYTNPSNPGVAYNQNGQVMNSIPSGNYQQVGPVGSNGQVAQDQGYQSAPVVPVKSSSSGLGWLWLLIILAGLVALYLVLRQKKINAINEEPHVNHTYFKNPEEKLRDIKDQFFVDFQENNRPSGINFIRDNTDGMMFNAVKNDVQSSNEDRVIEVKSLEAEVVNVVQDGTTYVASVRYQAEVVDNGASELIDQIWNFKYINNKWVLAGLTNV